MPPMKNTIGASSISLFLILLLSIPSMAQPGEQRDRSGKSAPTKPEDVTRFGIRIRNDGDTTFRYSLTRYNPSQTGSAVPNKGKNWKIQFSGYDESLLRVTDSTIVPLKAGRTPIVITYRPYDDTLALVVEQVGQNLVVDFDRVALRSVRMESLYQVNTWDTVGGARRAEDMKRLSTGMPINVALYTLGQPGVLAGGELPGVRIFPVDLQRSLYIEEKEERVAKVWFGPRREEW